MTDIEEQALALVNQVAANRGTSWLCIDRENDSRWEALCRFIEQLEAYKREVSDAVVKATHTMAAGKLVEASGILAAFILPKPVDPLVEALEEWINSRDLDDAASFRAAIEKRGGKIVWGEG